MCIGFILLSPSVSSEEENIFWGVPENSDSSLPTEDDILNQNPNIDDINIYTPGARTNINRNGRRIIHFDPINVEESPDSRVSSNPPRGLPRDQRSPPSLRWFTHDTDDTHSYSDGSADNEQFSNDTEPYHEKEHEHADEGDNESETRRNNNEEDSRKNFDPEDRSYIIENPENPRNRRSTVTTGEIFQSISEAHKVRENEFLSLQTTDLKYTLTSKTEDFTHQYEEAMTARTKIQDNQKKTLLLLEENILQFINQVNQAIEKVSQENLSFEEQNQNTNTKTVGEILTEHFKALSYERTSLFPSVLNNLYPHASRESTEREKFEDALKEIERDILELVPQTKQTRRALNFLGIAREMSHPKNKSSYDLLKEFLDAAQALKFMSLGWLEEDEYNFEDSVIKTENYFQKREILNTSYFSIQSQLKPLEGYELTRKQVSNELSMSLMKFSDKMISQRFYEEADFYIELSKKILNVASSFSPLLYQGSGEDFYELVTGRSLIAGRKIKFSERVIRALRILNENPNLSLELQLNLLSGILQWKSEGNELMKDHLEDGLESVIKQTKAILTSTQKLNLSDFCPSKPLKFISEEWTENKILDRRAYTFIKDILYSATLSSFFKEKLLRPITDTFYSSVLTPDSYEKAQKMSKISEFINNLKVSERKNLFQELDKKNQIISDQVSRNLFGKPYNKLNLQQLNEEAFVGAYMEEIRKHLSQNSNLLRRNGLWNDLVQLSSSLFLPHSFDLHDRDSKRTPAFSMIHIGGFSGLIILLVIIRIETTFQELSDTLNYIEELRDELIQEMTKDGRLNFNHPKAQKICAARKKLEQLKVKVMLQDTYELTKILYIDFMIPVQSSTANIVWGIPSNISSLYKSLKDHELIKEAADEIYFSVDD